MVKFTAHNSTYPKGLILCSKDSFLVYQTLVFQIKFCGEIPALRVAANRYHRVEPPTNFKQDVLC
jgi:hypothetical protein